MKKLLAILFDNAIKYAKGNSTISLKLRKHGRIATVTVSNVAENMTEEQTKKMFDRFYRADSARSSAGGFGIGLAMAQAITLSHNGKISAELSEDKLTVFVSHRLSSAVGASKIIVLDGGEAVEVGTHDELMRLGGEYAKLFTTQASRYIDQN